jgi:hypothetical protein
MMTVQRIATALVVVLQMSVTARVWDVDALLSTEEGMAKSGATTSKQVVESVLRQLEPGDALRLSRTTPLGDVVIGDVAEDIEVSGGFDGTMRFTGRAKNWRFVYAGANTDLVVERGADLSGAHFFCSFSGERIEDYSSSSYTSTGLGMVPAPAVSALHKSRVANGGGPGPGIRWGVKTFYYDDYGTRRTWMPVYYVDMAGAPDQTDDAQVELRRGREGGEWFFAIEANQNAGCVVLRMIDCQRLQLYSGSTEGAGNQTQGIYVMNNCEQVVLGMRRFFSNHRATSSWQGKPHISLLINQGSGNIIHNLIDIGNPVVRSLVSSDPSLQIWQTFFEDAARKQPGTFEFGVTYQGMINRVSYWTEPVQVGNEVILRRNGEDRLFEATPDLPVPPAFKNQPWQAGMSKRGASRAAAAPSRRYRESREFGAALLSAGADPTGRAYADAAFQKVMTTEERVEVPAGRFRLRHPLRPRAAGLAKGNGIRDPQYILGAGPSKTVIEVASGSEAVVDLRPHGLAKTGMPRSGQDMVVIDGLTLRGGECGMITPSAGLATVVSDFAITGYAKAGVLFEGAVADRAYNVVVPPEGEAGCGDNNQADTHLFSGGSFNGGDYGIYYTGFSDKQGIDGVSFSGHAQAGIASFHSNLFHGWIKGCNFDNIGGPGVDLSGGHIMPPGYGSSYYTQWVTMIEGCSFDECGSATRAAVDYGMADINMLCNSTIRTTGKSIKYGFLGSLAQMSNVDINVNASRAAVALRHPRGTEASRTPMTVIHTVTSNGPLMLVNGLASGQRGESPVGNDDPLKDFIYSSRLVEDTISNEFNHSGPKWWNRGEYGWAFPRLLYNSTFGGKEFDYVLTNEWGYARDLRTGATVDMSGVQYEGWERGAYPEVARPVYVNGDVRTGNIPEPRTLTVKNIGIGTLPAISVSSDVSWIQTSTGGEGNDQTLTLTFTEMPPSGYNTFVLRLTAGDISINVPVHFHMEDDRRPTIAKINGRIPVVSYGVPHTIPVTVFDQFHDTAKGGYTLEWKTYQDGASITSEGVLSAGPAPGFYGLTVEVTGSGRPDSVTYHSRYVIDNSSDAFTSTGDGWGVRPQCNRYMHCSYGEDYLSTDRVETALRKEQTAAARWDASTLVPGTYEVYVSNNNPRLHTYRITHSGGEAIRDLSVSEGEKVPMHEEYSKWYWVVLGEYTFGSEGGAVSIDLQDHLDLGRDRIHADAIMFDIPRSEWPDIDTTGNAVQTHRPQPPRVTVVSRKATMVVLYDVRGRELLRVPASRWRAEAGRLPAGSYVLVKFDKKGMVSKPRTLTTVRGR